MISKPRDRYAKFLGSVEMALTSNHAKIIVFKRSRWTTWHWFIITGTKDINQADIVDYTIVISPACDIKPTQQCNMC